jgi:hypothetical protein
MEELFLVIWIIIIAGILYSFKQYGNKQYADGMSDAINMHSTGALKYRIVTDKNGDNDIEIKINGG